MSEENRIGTYQFVAEPFHVDFNGRLTMGVLGNHLLNCAGFHANDRGFGIATLNEDNYTWVLSRLAIELDEMPYQYENFSVQTWVENVYRLFTDRNFAILDKDGKKIGYARSVWAMINLNTRKPADLLTLHGGSIVDYVCDEPCPIEKPSRIKVTSDQPIATLTAKYSDIDINGHVNSIRYIEHILDLFPIELYKTKRIRRFEMAYVAESYFGDELSFFKYYKKVSENVNYKIADDVYEACKNSDGTVNWEKVEERLKVLPATALGRGIPQVYLPHYSGDLDNLKPAFKAILPSVGGILSQLGYGDIAEYTSGYRDPERNASANGSPTSYHLEGNAVDVYLGNLTKEEQETIKENFSPYFSEILYHNAGSGLHLHLGNYIGGLDDRADDTEVTASAYSPNRLEKIKQRLKAKDADAKRIVKEKQQEVYENTVQAVTQAGTQEEALRILDNSSLPLAKQNALRRSINAKFKAINNDNLSVEDRFYLKYEKGIDYF